MDKICVLNFWWQHNNIVDSSASHPLPMGGLAVVIINILWHPRSYHPYIFGSSGPKTVTHVQWFI